MSRPIAIASAAVVLTAFSLPSSRADEQETRSAQAVVDALRANPSTLPYNVQVTPRAGAIVLSGRVGTKQIHDVVVQTVIGLGLIPHDELIIDTSEAHRVAFQQSGGGPGAGFPAAGAAAPYLVYPPPSFGRLDDPFWGFEPPLLSLPPGPPRAAPRVATSPSPRNPPARPEDDDGSVKGRVRLIIDAAGQVFLTGEVATENDRREIEREVRQAVGGADLVSRLEVADHPETPPPPEPMIVPPIDLDGRETPKADAPKPGAERGRDDLARRVVDALGRRPALKGAPLKVESRDGVVTISGRVPTALEAMLAYRAAEQTPGAREVVDRLEFPMPDENHPNPLRDQASPNDLEPYLTRQIRRHVGDSAHIDRVRVRGGVVEVHGATAPDDEESRIVAILRSMPLLRDFRIEARLDRDW